MKCNAPMKSLALETLLSASTMQSNKKLRTEARHANFLLNSTATPSSSTIVSSVSGDSEHEFSTLTFFWEFRTRSINMNFQCNHWSTLFHLPIFSSFWFFSTWSAPNISFRFLPGLPAWIINSRFVISSFVILLPTIESLLS